MLSNPFTAVANLEPLTEDTQYVLPVLHSVDIVDQQQCRRPPLPVIKVDEESRRDSVKKVRIER